ncbi:MAG: PKD domain-containing protein, partial [Deltaproteobacteria bacterium]|nr:PKD domain-containing protein [Deltaproteobacteria bacterium]
METTTACSASSKLNSCSNSPLASAGVHASADAPFLASSTATATNQPEPVYAYYWRWSGPSETLHQEGLPGAFPFQPGKTYNACSRVYHRIYRCLSAETCQVVGTESCLTPTGSLTFEFAGHANLDVWPSGETLTWDFGDGATAPGNWSQEDPDVAPLSIDFVPIQHTYAKAGTYTVCATLSNGSESTKTCIEVKVGDTLEPVSLGKVTEL